MSRHTHAAFGWTSIALGIGMGLVLGLWSFGGPVAPPESLADYASLPRRLIRLSHIAFVALGGLNVLVGLSKPETAGRAGQAGGSLFLFGSAFLPPLLAVSALVPPAAPACALPALSVGVGAALIAVEAWQRRLRN